MGIFEKSSSDDATSWTQVAKLKADDGAAWHLFGASVSISDGIVAVGARSSDRADGYGSVYIFEKSSSDDASSWGQMAKLKADDAGWRDEFGISVAISKGIVVVGAYKDD